MDAKLDESKILPHHEQQPLCTTRLPYRQGRKLTAVKVYTINDESKHLLIFGVPSLNIRQETKALFQQFGKILQFTLAPSYEKELFTETYHLVYERIQSARVAKKILDTKNFYGGSLHICYAPELETIEETKQKIVQRKKDVLFRINYLSKNQITEDKTTNLVVNETLVDNGLNSVVNTENSGHYNNEMVEMTSSKTSYNLDLPQHLIQKSAEIFDKNTTKDSANNLQRRKLNMGELNTISIEKQIKDVVFKKKKAKPTQKPSYSKKQFDLLIEANKKLVETSSNMVETNSNMVETNSNIVEIVDVTSTDNDIVTNINVVDNSVSKKDVIIKKVPQKPLNVIKFNLRNNKLS